VDNKIDAQLCEDEVKKWAFGLKAIKLIESVRGARHKSSALLQQGWISKSWFDHLQH
jgi:hypothetical protein